MALLRETLLRLSQSRWLERQVRRRKSARKTVARFLPGEDVSAALAAARTLARQEIRSVLTLLGENVTDPREAEAVTEHYLEVLARARDPALDAQISVKPTQLGLDLRLERARAHVTALVERARELENFVWIDMEGSRYLEPTLELFRQVRAKSENVGVCLQAYLHRTPRDLEELLSRSAAIRLVKGAYREPPTIAYPKRRDVDAAFLELAGKLLEAARREGTRPAFGTHDLEIVREIGTRADAAGLPRDAYEIQMLYGIQREAQTRLAAEGHRVRVLISYGTAWYPWFMRRLAERPANLWFVVRNLWAA